METQETGSGAGEETQGTTPPWQSEEKTDDAPAWAQRLEQRFEQMAPKEEAEADDDYEWDDDDYYEDDEESEGELTQEDIAVLQQMSPDQLAAMGIDPSIVHGIQADPEFRAMQDKLQALEERSKTETAQREEARRDAEAEALEQLYPDLQKPEVAKKVIDQAERLVRQMRPGLDRDEVTNQALEPSFLELVYKAQLADERSEQEIPASRPRVGVETGGGANPDGEDAEAEARKRIVGASRGGFNFMS